MASLLEASGALRSVLRSSDPGDYPGADCAVLAEELARTEKACAAWRARAAARAVTCGAHRGRGFGDGAEWLARQVGSTLSEARGELCAARALEGVPAALAAASSGELSLAQASEVAKAEAALAGSGAGLVEAARGASLGSLREQARRVVLSATGVEALHERQHRSRSLRFWSDGQGMVCFSGQLPPVVGVGLRNRVEAEAARQRRAAGGAGRAEGLAAHAADALAGLLSGPPVPLRAEVVYVVSAEAAIRGHVEGGEICHLISGGPVPVPHANAEAARGAFLKVLELKGLDIGRVAHIGRRAPAELRTALSLGAPPHFEGAACRVDGCGRRYGLEWDHVDPVANGGKTSYANLSAKCWGHHREKTEADRAAGLLGPHQAHQPGRARRGR